MNCVILPSQWVDREHHVPSSIILKNGTSSVSLPPNCGKLWILFSQKEEYIKSVKLIDHKKCLYSFSWRTRSVLKIFLIVTVEKWTTKNNRQTQICHKKNSGAKCKIPLKISSEFQYQFHLDGKEGKMF